MSALSEYLDNVDADAADRRDLDVPRLTAALRKIESWHIEIWPDCDDCGQRWPCRTRRILDGITGSGGSNE